MSDLRALAAGNKFIFQALRTHAPSPALGHCGSHPTGCLWSVADGPYPLPSLIFMNIFEKIMPLLRQAGGSVTFNYGANHNVSGPARARRPAREE